MKKLLALILTLTLTLTLALSLTACGKDKDTDDKGGKSSAIIGTWESDFKLGKAIESAIAGEDLGDGEEAAIFEDALKGISFDKYTAKTTLVFKAGSKYSMEISKDEASAAIKSFMQEFGGNIADSFEKELDGTGLTLEGAFGMSREFFINTLMEEFDTADIEKEFDDFSESGKYDLDGSTLTLTDEDGEKTVFEIELGSDKLTLVDIADSEEDEGNAAIYNGIFPWTFEKVK